MTLKTRNCVPTYQRLYNLCEMCKKHRKIGKTRHDEYHAKIMSSPDFYPVKISECSSSCGQTYLKNPDYYCCVCSKVLANTPIVFTKCNHVLHIGCVQTDITKCPYCDCQISMANDRNNNPELYDQIQDCLTVMYNINPSKTYLYLSTIRAFLCEPKMEQMWSDIPTSPDDIYVDIDMAQYNPKPVPIVNDCDGGESSTTQSTNIFQHIFSWFK